MPKVRDEDIWGDDDPIHFEEVRLTRPVKTKVAKVGDSKGFIVPKGVFEYLGLSVGDPVHIWIEKRRE